MENGRKDVRLISNSKKYHQQKKRNSPESGFVPHFVDYPKDGGDLLSHKNAVPSAQSGLTSLFGMGRGGTPML